VVEAAGIHDILSKNHGSNNQINVVKAAIKALQALRSPEEQAAARGKTLEELGLVRTETLPAPAVAEGFGDGPTA
jgi:ribosomal protein S5